MNTTPNITPYVVALAMAWHACQPPHFDARDYHNHEETACCVYSSPAALSVTSLAPGATGCLPITPHF